jgi:hypothetical protein
MLLFLATVLEQLDLALEHVSKRDVHNARFGLMLTDNAIELVLHQTAKDRAAKLKAYAYLREEYSNKAALEKALGRAFDAKVRFAKLEGDLSGDVAKTLLIMHGFRNEVYHVGLQHEAILHELALFYFDVACEYLGTFKPQGFGWASNQKLPERAKKYFQGDAFFPGDMDDFSKGCAALLKASGHDASDTIAVLADHMDEVIYDQNVCIDIVAQGVYKGQQKTRDQAVIDSQAWPLAFSEEGKAFARDRGWTGSVFHLVEWLSEEYPLRFKRDPISSWEKQAAKLRAQKNPHAALAHYHSFMSETATLREALMESASAAEAEIDAAVDRARGK